VCQFSQREHPALVNVAAMEIALKIAGVTNTA
jgi:hypothetical protein